MDEKVKEHLENALTAYKGNLEGVAEFIQNAKQSLEGATAQKELLDSRITELKEILGIENEPEETETSEETETPEETEVAEEPVVAE